MLQRLEELIEIVKTWPEARQADVAAMLEAMDGQTASERYRVSDEERRAIDASRAQCDRGDFASDTEVAAVLDKHGL